MTNLVERLKDNLHLRYWSTRLTYLVSMMTGFKSFQKEGPWVLSWERLFLKVWESIAPLQVQLSISIDQKFI